MPLAIRCWHHSTRSLMFALKAEHFAGRATSLKCIGKSQNIFPREKRMRSDCVGNGMCGPGSPTLPLNMEGERWRTERAGGNRCQRGPTGANPRRHPSAQVPTCHSMHLLRYLLADYLKEMARGNQRILTTLSLHKNTGGSREKNAYRTETAV